jgi:hypothetical protein
MITWNPNKGLLVFLVGFILVIFYLVNILVPKNIPNKPTRYALLIGGGVNSCNNFNSFYKNIEYVANSLKQMGYSDENVKILFYGGKSSDRLLAEADATRKNVIDEIKNYEEIIDSNDSLLIFRSGHGIIELVFEEYGILPIHRLVPDNLIKKIKGTAAVMSFPDGQLSYLEFQERLGRIKAGQIVLILNQCYSGQFTEIATKLDKTVVVSETGEVGIAFFSNRNTERWNYKVWPYVKCIFDGFLSCNGGKCKKSVHEAYTYMLSCNPNVEGLPVKADKPLLRETPQIKYGRGLKKGSVYIN